MNAHEGFNFFHREKRNGTASETAQEAFLEKERDIRLALTNNLAKAIIIEGTVES